ncbi:hypothetical protein HPB50_021895 [Hyalomma asiaticum]|uniref:Uncharacterized protein n=1 Tax=Hyalomma asiaticum TaxID=266040 RepID=A0ACB7T4J9_HYAAI|nr:hypothetical protein HPB50_021895 [Hyalomma asiaticum]
MFVLFCFTRFAVAVAKLRNKPFTIAEANVGFPKAFGTKSASPETPLGVPALYRGVSPWRQLLMVLWKNIYVKRLQRHYTTTLLEIVLMVVLLLGIQEDAVVREPLLRRGDTHFRPINTYSYWNTQRDMAQVTKVFFAPVDNRYLARLTHAAMADLRVTYVAGFASEKELVAAMRLQNSTPVHTVALLYSDVAPGDRDGVPVSLHVNFFGGRLPFDVRVFFAPVDNRYLARLTHAAMADLRVTYVAGFASEKELVAAMRLQNSTPVHTVALLYSDVAPGDRDGVPVSLHVNFFGGRLPFDVRVNYPQRILSQPEGPSKEERFPEVNTLLPIMGALQQRHLEYHAKLHNRTMGRMQQVRLHRFPYPAYIEHKDTKNYALVLTRFCVGMLVPFAVFVARLSDEKTTGAHEF